MSPRADATDQRFFFVHLHKTAGTTVWSRLRNHFSEEEMYPASFDGSPLRRTVSVEDLVARWPDRRGDVRVVAGHFPWCTQRLLGDRFVTFTLLRDPIDRCLSALRELQQKVPEFDSVDFADIYDDPLRQPMLRNHMVKMFALRPEQMTDGFLTPIDVGVGDVDGAIDALATCDHVGFNDDVEGFCAELAERYSWDLGEPVRANTSDPVVIPERLVERIRRDNAADIEFYAEARRRFGPDGSG